VIRILRNIPRIVIVLVVAGGAAIGGIAASWSASSVPSASALAPRMTAAELANGLLFNQGKAAHYLVALGRPTIRMTNDVVALERSVDHALETQTALASRFAGDVQSGSRVKVQAGLVTLAGFTYRASTHVFGRSVTHKVVAQATVMLDSAMSPAEQGMPAGTYKCELSWSSDAAMRYEGPLVRVWVPVLVAALRAGRGDLAAEHLINLVATSLQATR
jgi:hypothetical protein